MDKKQLNKINKSQIITILKSKYLITSRFVRALNKRVVKFGQIKLKLAYKKVSKIYSQIIKNKYVNKYSLIIVGIVLLLSTGLVRQNNSDITANTDIIALETGVFLNNNQDFVIEFGSDDKNESDKVRFSAYPNLDEENPFMNGEEGEKEQNIFVNAKNKIGKIFGVKGQGIEMVFIGARVEDDIENVLSGELKDRIDASKKDVKTDMELVSSGNVVEADRTAYALDLDTSTSTPEDGQALSDKEVDDESRDTIIQSDVVEGVDIVYQILEGVGLKEEIVIRNIDAFRAECLDDNDTCPLPNNAYSFLLKLDDGVQIKQSDNAVGSINKGAYYFEDQNGRYLYHFLPLFAEDKVGAVTTDVFLDVQPTDNDNEYRIEVILNLKWLLDSSRVFPVRIDPSIVHDTSAEFATGIFNRAKDVGSPELVSYYQELAADEHTVGLWHMNEIIDNSCSGGEDVCDLSDNGNNGTVTGTTIVDAKMSKSRSFDGTDDYVSFGDIEFMDTPPVFTFESWFNRTSDINSATNHGTENVIVGQSSSTTNDNLEIGSDGTEIDLYIDSVDFETFVSFEAGITNNTWYHIAVVYDSNQGNEVKVYLDGELKYESSTWGGLLDDSDTSPLSFGIARPADGNWGDFNGQIDEVRISNIARTPEEIKASASRRPSAVYTSSVIDLGGAVTSWNGISWDELGVATGDGETLKSTSGLVAQWDFNETSGTTADNNEGTVALDGVLMSTAPALSVGDGADGSVTFSVSTDINTTNRITSRTCSQGGDAVNYSVSSLASGSAVVTLAPNSGCLTIGDEVLLINLQGTITAFTNVGNYEILEVASISGTTVNFTSSKTKYYGNGSSDDTNIGTSTSNQRVMLQRVPNYTNVTVNSGINVYPSAFNAIKGGVLAFKANGTTTVTGTIHANSKGYRGGAGGIDYGKGKTGGSICMTNTTTGSSSCGGGSGGTGLDCSGSGCDDRFLESGFSGSGSSGGSGGGGGAAAGYSTRNAPAGGGGGGGYGSLGYGGEGGRNPGGYATDGQDGFNGGTNTSGTGGYARLDQYIGQAGGGGGGGTYGSATLSDMFFGTGGAGGGCGDAGGTINNPDSEENGYAGGTGGGIVYIYTDNLVTSGTISANGQSASTVDSYYSGSGGGGAGGSILLMGNTISLTGVSATYGNGGPSQFDRKGGGGNGGNGRIAVEYATSVSGTSSPAANTTQITGGGNGLVPVWTQANQRWGAGALMFDGGGGYVNAGNDTSLQITGALTIETWINTDTLAAYQGIVGKMGGGGGNYGYLLRESGSPAGYAELGVSSTGSNYQNVIGTTLINDGNWHHIVGVYTPSTSLKIYVDGVLQNTNSTAVVSSIYNTSYDVSVGSSYSTPAEFFKGTIDSTRIYSRALTSYEILSNYNSSNIQFQTRVGSDASPDDGSWDDWSSINGETTINTFDSDSANWSWDNTAAYMPQLKSNESDIKMVGTGSLKQIVGQSQVDANTVGLWHLDETSGMGAYIKDSTANANHGTPAGTTVVDGMSGKSRNFDGISDVISLGSPASLDFGNNGAFTMDGWIKPTALKDYGAFVSKNSNRASPYSYMTVTHADGRLAAYNGSSWITICPADSVSNDHWYHIAYAYNGATIYGYVNGANCGSASFIYTDDAADTIDIGSWHTNIIYDFDGLIDEVRISNIARTPEEIAEAYRMGRDHYLNKTITSIDLSNKQSLPFYIAADRPGTYLNMTVGESAYVNYQTDANTVGLWHLDNNFETSGYGVGGIITYSGGKTIHTFTSSGTFIANNIEDVEVLIVGGGGGGSGSTWGGGGGGAGGILYKADHTISGTNTVTVGGGGLASVSGSNSSFGALTAFGGGRGYTSQTASDRDGGSGGGAGHMNPAGAVSASIQTSNNGGVGYGNGGGASIYANPYNCGSGGGAGAVGTTGGAGGAGKSFSISGSSVYYAGGGGQANTDLGGNTVGGSGGGGAGNDTGNGVAGATNTGGGGGGSRSGSGGWGGSGIVIVSYPTDRVITKDSSGNGNDSTFTDTNLTQGKIGRGMNFDGVSDYILTTASNIPPGATGEDITADFWIYPTDLSSSIGLMSKGGYTSGGFDWYIGLENSGQIWIRTNGSNNNGTINTLSTDQWYHISVIWDVGTGFTIYVNGQKWDSNTNNSADTSTGTENTFVIGSTYNGGAVYQSRFEGVMDEVRISNTIRSASEIRQTYEVGLRTHSITIDFAAKLDGGSWPIEFCGGCDWYSFNVDATVYGLPKKGSNLYPGDKLIVRENQSGTEFIIQGTVISVNEDTGAVTVDSWSDTPGFGFTSNATVFKWQREYFHVADNTLDSHIDAITNITFRLTNGHEGRTIWLDDLKSVDNYLTNPFGSSITSNTGNRYIQYRSIFTSNDYDVSSSLTDVTFDYVTGPSNEQLMRHGKWFNNGIKQSYWWVEN